MVLSPAPKARAGYAPPFPTQFQKWRRKTLESRHSMKGSNPFLKGMSGAFGNYVVTQHGSQTIVRQRVMTNPTRTQAQVEAQIRFKAISQGFKMLSEAGRQSYRDLGARIPGKSGKPMSGSNCYATITATRALQGLPPLEMAPSPVLQNPMLPPSLLLTAVNDGSTFGLIINSSGFNGPVLLEACAWTSAGVSYFNAAAFRVCAVLNALDVGNTPISSEFLALFSVPPAGSQVAIRLTPLTETGFRGAASVFTASVAATAEAMQDDLETRQAGQGRRTVLRLAA